MKRIANNVAVATLLFTMNPQTEIRIIDAEYHLISYIRDWSSQGIPDGEILTVDEILHHEENAQFARARIRRTEIVNNQLLLIIDTKDDEYSDNH